MLQKDIRRASNNTKLLPLVLSFVLLCGCASDDDWSSSSVGPWEVDTSVELHVDLGDEYEEYCELETRFYTGRNRDYRMMKAYFLAPYDATEEEIAAHAKAYCEVACAEEPLAFMIYLEYYDEQMFYECKDTPIAEADWAPYGDTGNNRHVSVTDFSTHKVTVKFYNPCNEEYALSNEEKELYQSMQQAYHEVAGYYAFDVYGKDQLMPDEYEDYLEVAEMLGVDVDTLIDLRVKVTLWREEVICEHMLPE